MEDLYTLWCIRDPYHLSHNYSACTCRADGIVVLHHQAQRWLYQSGHKIIELPSSLLSLYLHHTLSLYHFYLILTCCHPCVYVCVYQFTLFLYAQCLFFPPHLSFCDFLCTFCICIVEGSLITRISLPATASL